MSLNKAARSLRTRRMWLVDGGMFKKVNGKAAAREVRGVLYLVRRESKRHENAALGLFQHPVNAEVVEWQTRTFEGRVAQAVRVQVPPSAPNTWQFLPLQAASGAQNQCLRHHPYTALLGLFSGSDIAAESM